MVRATRTLFALLAVLTACAPLLNGRVICSTDAGHYAVEPAHVSVAGCSAVAGSQYQGDPEPCEDRPLDDGTLAVQRAESSLQATDFAPAVHWIASVSFVAAAVDLTPTHAGHPPLLRSDRHRLASVVLLV